MVEHGHDFIEVELGELLAVQRVTLVHRHAVVDLLQVKIDLVNGTTK